MNTPILNRDFQHPADGWYQIEALGNHPNRAAGVIQIVDTDAANSIVKTFNHAAAAGKLRHGHEMLIDHEHFSDQPDQETRAYGWLQELKNRDDGIYGRIRWTATGQVAVDGGDYRFFSTEYEPKDLAPVETALANRKSGMKSVRPLRLSGLTVTNMNNNRGQKPITNKETMKKLPKNKMCPECDVALKRGADGDNDYECPECGTHFAGSDEPAATKNKDTKKMNKIANKLGLAAEASEDAILEAVTKIMNRNAELEPLAADNTKLKNRLTQLDNDAVDALLASHGVKEEKILNRLKPVVLALPTLAERTAAVVDFGFKPVEAGKTTRRAANRVRRWRRQPGHSRENPQPGQ